MAAPDIITKRIHVGGLTPSITPAHIKDRFKSFGNVLDVEDLKADALGQPRPFTFFTIQTTPPQLVKCLNIMSGSMWRGCQLRLAEAKPRYDIRLKEERNPTKEATDERIRKRKRRAITVRAADVGKEAQDMRTPSEENYKTKKFWTVDPTGHLIRPVTLTPTHPLPRPDTFKMSKEDAKKRRNPPSRLNMRVINPSIWKPIHLTETALEEDEVEVELGEEGWEFESASEDEEDDEGKVLVGRWIKSTDAGVEAEEVWVNNRAVEGEIPVEDEEVEAGQGDGSRSASPLFGRRDRSASPLFPTQRARTSASPLFSSRKEDAVQDAPVAEEDEKSASEDDFPLFTATAQETAARSRSASPLFPGRQSTEPSAAKKRAMPPPPPVVQIPVVEEEEVSASEDDFPLLTAPTQAKAVPSGPTSPLFPGRSVATKKRATAPPPPAKDIHKEVVQEHVLPDPIRETAKAEKSRDLGLLASFLGEEVPAAAKPTRGEWAGFDEESDDEEVMPLRIRGGKGDEEDEEMEESSSEESDEDSSSDSSDSSDSTESSDSDEDESDKEVSPQAGVPAPAPAAQTVAPAPAQKTQSVLKAMFAPAPAASSFSLLGALDADIELDEELDIPLAPPPIRQVYESAADLQPLAASKKSHFDPDPSIPLFFPSFGRGGKDAMKADVEQEGYTGFWRQETDEEMKEIWEKDKVELTRDWKKRYRDGKKQRKRRGGGNDVE